MYKKNEKYEIRPCVSCKSEHKIFDRNKWLCKECASARKKGISDKQTNEDYPSDLQSIFMDIWQAREHVCYHCGCELGEEPSPIFFSHILSRGAHPGLRCDPENIVLACRKCHYIYDFSSKDALDRQIPQELIEKLLKKERNGLR